MSKRCRSPVSNKFSDWNDSRAPSNPSQVTLWCDLTGSRLSEALFSKWRFQGENGCMTACVSDELAMCRRAITEKRRPMPGTRTCSSSMQHPLVSTSKTHFPLFKRSPPLQHDRAHVLLSSIAHRPLAFATSATSYLRER